MCKKFMENGRSMIEMLGVLAIIAVLSVGGIAGYSKAMEKFKLNKLVAEYGDVLRGLIEYKDNLLRVNPDAQTGLAEVLQAANIVPDSWSRQDAIWFIDATGNKIAFYSMKKQQGKTVAMDIYLGGFTENDDGNNITANFSEKVCLDLFNNVLYPLHSAVFYINVSYLEKQWVLTSFMGDGYCNAGDKCLADLSMADFQAACQVCKNKNTQCDIGIKLQ